MEDRIDPSPHRIGSSRGLVCHPDLRLETGGGCISPDAPGTVMALDDSTGIATGDGLLILDTLQMEGRRPTTASDFVQGYKGFVGSHLGL